MPLRPGFDFGVGLGRLQHNLTRSPSSARVGTTANWGGTWTDPNTRPLNFGEKTSSNIKFCYEVLKLTSMWCY